MSASFMQVLRVQGKSEPGPMPPKTTIPDLVPDLKSAAGNRNTFLTAPWVAMLGEHFARKEAWAPHSPEVVLCDSMTGFGF